MAAAVLTEFPTKILSNTNDRITRVKRERTPSLSRKQSSTVSKDKVMNNTEKKSVSPKGKLKTGSPTSADTRASSSVTDALRTAKRLSRNSTEIRIPTRRNTLILESKGSKPSRTSTSSSIKRKVSNDKSLPSTDASSTAKKELPKRIPSTQGTLKKESTPAKVTSPIITPLPDQANINSDSKNDQERLLTLKDIVVQAKLDRKIFSIFDRHTYIAQPIREELYKRGWIECVVERDTVLRKQQTSQRLANPNMSHSKKSIVTSTGQPTQFRILEPEQEIGASNYNVWIREFGERYQMDVPDFNWTNRRRRPAHPFIQQHELQTVSQLVHAMNFELNFVWLSGKPALQLQNFLYQPDVVNKFQKTTFCSKLGLWENLRNYIKLPSCIQWPLQYPRMYNPKDKIDNEHFGLNYKLTACWSILTWLVTSITRNGLSSVLDLEGEVSLRAFEYATKKCNDYIRYIAMKPSVMTDELKGNEEAWSQFLHYFYGVVSFGMKIRTTNCNHLVNIHRRAYDVLKRLHALSPSIENDGYLNLWIVKPYSAACGRGIFITNNLPYMQNLHPRYIIQKYIERPFLIENTKFDIRQWFMITSLHPLHVWMYDECYLRFCSLPFNLKNLHESIHLSNNAVQRKYVSQTNMIEQNMWDSQTFQHYLRKCGYSDIWQHRIFPGMRDAIICALLHSQHTFDEQTAGSFEIFGADFMLSENIREGPWLIEINESPAMDHSTYVTTRLCDQMLRDVIKVVIDRRENPRADCGGWLLVYEQDKS